MSHTLDYHLLTVGNANVRTLLAFKRERPNVKASLTRGRIGNVVRTYGVRKP